MVRDHGFGHLVVAGHGGLDAVPVPVLVDEPDAGVGPDGAGLRVRAHVAKANPLWRAAPCPTLLIASPAVVPTWNYELVHVHGTLRAHHDPAWVEAVVRELTARHEGSLPAPWSV